MRKKSLVCGGAGFIGSHLCERLLKDGNEVICLDNYFSGSKDNIRHLLSNPYFEVIRWNVIHPYHIECDEIYNLACPASPVHYQYNPTQTIDTSVQGMINAVRLARKLDVKVLQASTSEVYGDPKEHPQKETYWGNVNPVGIRSCFSEDTEILTESGWISFPNLYENYLLNGNIKVVTLNENTGYIEYQLPTDLIKEEYDGELLSFKNWHCDLLVTPSHKMYVSERKLDSYQDYKLIPAFKIGQCQRPRMKKTALYKGENVEWFYFPDNIDRKNSKTKEIKRIRMDDWLEFFGYYITEGCTYIQNKKRIVNQKEYDTNQYRILIAQSKEKNPEKYIKIENCLKRLPFSITKIEHQFQIINKQLANYLIQFGKSHEKYIPQELLKTSQRQLKILFDAMILGDGSIKNGKISYSSNSEKLIANFQELLLKLGMASNIGIKDKRKKRFVYQLHILTNNNIKSHLNPSYPEATIVNYEGNVYCVTVPNHIIFVRRNGKALFCGNCYDEGKRCAETICMDYFRQFYVRVKIARIHNTYGPHMLPNDGRVISNFITQALANRDITIYGDGTQTRSFMYVDDLIEGLIKLMETESSFTGPVNIGNPNESTINFIADKIIDMTGSSSKLAYLPLPQDDPIQRQPDITLAEEKLNWKPKVDLHTGLILTINYFKKL